MSSRRPSNEAVLGRRIAELDAQISATRDVLCRLYLIQQRVSLQEDLRALHRAKFTMIGAGRSSSGTKKGAIGRDVHRLAPQAIGGP
jgi:hypothetical protein